jgi:type II secretory pathway pseudopilin PulG
MQRVRRTRARGFTIVEAIVALSITAMAGAVLLLAVESTVHSTADSVQRTIADGLAQQLLDEAVMLHFVAPGGDPLSNSLGPNGQEAAGTGRERYNDADDYHNFTAQPPEELYGHPVGWGNDGGGLRHSNFRVPAGYFDNWRQRVEVYFVREDDHRVRLTSGTSLFRAIEVHIDIQDSDGVYRTLASRKRIVAYVEPPD